MKLRHATALALVGWYLVQPPESSLVPGKDYPAKAPFSEWLVVGAVKSQAECDEQNQRFAFTLSQEPNVAILTNAPLNLTRCITAEEARAAGLLKHPVGLRR
jgi:hypothetical protein